MGGKLSERCVQLRDSLSKPIVDYLTRHAFGHITLGHIRLGDRVAHYDVAAELQDRNRQLCHWDAQVQEHLGSSEGSITESYDTMGLSEVEMRLATGRIDQSALSAAILHQRFRNEIVEIPQAITERASLFPHQTRGIAETVARLNRFNVSILADSVGLGKTRTVCAVIRTLRDQNLLTKAAIITPRKLERNWYKEMAVVGLEEGRDCLVLNKDKFKRMSPQEAASALRGAKLVVVEEAHQDLRNPGNRFHRNLRDAAGMASGLLVTATPWNNRRGDIFAILSPFVRPRLGEAEGVFDCFKRGFRTGRKEFEESDEIFRRIYALTVLQRTRRQLREMGDAGVFYAPREPKLDVVPYTSAQQSAFRALLEAVEALRLPYFNPVRYLTEETDAEWRLSGTYRFFMLKRAESSMAALRLTLQGMRIRAEALRTELREVKDGEDDVARWLAGYYHIADDVINEVIESDEGALAAENVTRPRQRRALRLIEDARRRGRLRPLRRKLLEECEQDIRLLGSVGAEFAELFESDPKLGMVIEATRQAIADGQKVLLISQFADTAFIVYKTFLEDDAIRGAGVGLVMSTAKSGESPIQVNGSAATRDQVLQRFAPQAWEQNSIETRDQPAASQLSQGQEISVLVGSDTLSVGQNLQDARVILQLDLTWNPMVLEQRIGRLDRPRHESDDAPIQIRYFLNLDLIEAELKLKKKIDERLEATYRDTHFDDEILPGYFELIETMRKLRSERANADDIAREIEALLQELTTAKPAEVTDLGVESRRAALDHLHEAVSDVDLPEPLPPLVLTVGATDIARAEIAAELELQAYDNNEGKIGHPSQHLLVLTAAMSGEGIDTSLDDLPRTVEAMLRPAKESIAKCDYVPLLRAFDREATQLTAKLRDERNRLREKHREIRERTRPTWLPPLIQTVGAFLDKLPEKQYEAFLERYGIADDELGRWLDKLAAGVDLDDREMVERLRRLETKPALIVEEFGAIREIVEESDEAAPESPSQLSLEIEPYVNRIDARVTNLRLNIPSA